MKHLLPRTKITQKEDVFGYCPFCNSAGCSGSCSGSCSGGCYGGCSGDCSGTSK